MLLSPHMSTKSASKFYGILEQELDELYYEGIAGGKLKGALVMVRADQKGKEFDLPDCGRARPTTHRVQYVKSWHRLVLIRSRQLVLETFACFFHHNIRIGPTQGNRLYS